MGTLIAQNHRVLGKGDSVLSLLSGPWDLKTFDCKRLPLGEKLGTIKSLEPWHGEKPNTCLQKQGLSWHWWCTPLIPALGWQRQKHLCEFKVS